MKVLDIVYYGMYRFTRGLGHKPLDAEAISGILMPLLFLLPAFFLCYVMIYEFEPGMIPHKIRPYLVGVAVVIWILSFIIYAKKGRGRRIISEYEKRKDQKLYIWLGALFVIFTLTCPIFAGLLLRVIL